MNLTDLLESATVIAAVRSAAQLKVALQSDSTLLFFLSSDLDTLEEQICKAHQAEKKVFVHFDLVEGLRRDPVALRYLHQRFLVDGIITTHSSVVRAAKEQGVSCIQRLFLLDSESVSTGAQSIKKVLPDAVELLPGLLTRQIREFSQRVSIPIIAGGLIQAKSEIIDCLKAGAISVSTSNPTLWNL